MLSSQSNPRLSAADFRIHGCSRCRTPMTLVIEPDKLGFDQRTFKCARCGHDEVLLVAI
jgi:hypothetical protein